MANPHALVLPANGQGHVNGCMQLAQSLAAVGFNVTFVYFSSYYDKLKAQKRLVVPDRGYTEEGGGPSSNEHTTTTSPSSGNDGSASSVHEGGDPCSNGAIRTTAEGGSNGENAKGSIHIHVVEDGFGPGDIDKLFFVTPAMKENLFNLILELREQGTPPCCLISDTFLPWSLYVAQRAGIPRIDYWTSNAMSYILVHSVPLLFSEGIFPEKGIIIASLSFLRNFPPYFPHAGLHKVLQGRHCGWTRPSMWDVGAPMPLANFAVRPLQKLMMLNKHCDKLQKTTENVQTACERK